MATQTDSRTRRRSTTAQRRSGNAQSSGGGGSSNSERTQNRSSRERSAFSWGNGGGMIGAAAAGAALVIAANFSRKFLTQAMVAGTGDWDKTLAAEHQAALALFDRILATEDTQTTKRAMLLMKLKHALDKHAHQEEHVIYPALRNANDAHDADLLETEHGYVKTFLYDLESTSKSSPEWITKVREFREAVAKHARMEEEQVFPRLKQAISEEQNARLTSKMNRDGFMMA